MAKSNSDPTPTNFEDAFSQLDVIVENLEKDGVPLADLVSQYDRGMKLLEACQTKLEAAKQRVASIRSSYQSTADDFESPKAEDINDELF